MCNRREAVRVGWALAVLLSSVYLLTYRGLFRAIDELALFSMTESLAQNLSTQTPQVSFAGYHNGVGRLEPLYSVLAVPLYWVAVRIQQVGNIQAAMLLNVGITAGTGVALYGLLLMLGHSQRRSVLAAMVYGLATMAWPYSRSFFREPLCALLLVLAMLAFAGWSRSGRRAYLGAMLVCLALGPLAKVTSVLVWPGFVLTVVLEEGRPWRERKRRLLMLLLVGIVGGGLAAGVYLTRMSGGLGGLGTYLSAMADPGLVLSRVFALTFGPARGLFVFCPVLLLALPGLVLLWIKRRTYAVLVASCFLVCVVGYSTYPEWHGGMSWGPRFMVPLIPLLMLAVAECLSPKKAVYGAAIGLLVMVSAGLQFVASTVDYSLQVEAGAWENRTDYVRSPAVQQLGIWKPAHLDMLWWHGTAGEQQMPVYTDGWIALPLIASGGVAAVLLGWLMSHRGASARWTWALYPVLSLLLLTGVLVLMCRARAAMVGYAGVDPAELGDVAVLASQDPQPHVVVTVSNEFHVNVLLNGLKGHFVHYWLSPSQDSGFEVLLSPPFPAHSLSLIIDRVHMPIGQIGREVEFFLNANLYRYAVNWVGSGYEVYRYLFPPNEMSMRQGSAQWAAGMSMPAYGIVPLTVSAGEPVWVELRFEAVQKPGADYDLFVQLLAPDGHQVQGMDGPPQFGARSTSRWEPGEMVVDRRAMVVPEGSPGGAYQVIAGFYDHTGRQPVLDSAGQVSGTYVELGTVQVRAR